MAAVQQQQQQQQPTTQLEFHQAMADFKTMFPDMDPEVIEAVLRSNQGAVDATIDQLLSMSTDNENEKLRHEIETNESQVDAPLIRLSVSPPTTSSPAKITSSLINEDSPSRGASSIEIASKTQETSSITNKQDIPLNVLHGWIPALLGPLPDDFLRLSPIPWTSSVTSSPSSAAQKLVLSQQLLQQKFVENQQRRVVIDSLGDPELDRYLEDERIALFLQNEEFMSELRWNKEFLSTLDDDNSSDKDFLENKSTFSKSSSGHDDDAIFKERLRNMGKMSKKKFAQLARVFTRSRKRSGNSSNANTSKAMPHDNLLLNSEPLIDDDDDDDEATPIPPSRDRVRQK